MERLTERSENGKAVYRHPTPEPEGWKANRSAVLDKCCRYEETGFEPEEITLFKSDYEKRTCTGCWLKDEKGIAIKINELKDLLGLAVEELENIYERDTELTERIREVI